MRSVPSEASHMGREMRRGLAEVTKLLGPPGAVERAADAIVAELALRGSNAK